jgi:AcrR family transcriptional regulator
MAKRQARFTLEDLDGLPQLEDDSADLWSEELGTVTRTLLTSAVRCFALNGFHATTTRDISLASGLSAAAMYVHFSSKEDVLFEIMKAGHQRVLDHIREPEVMAIEDAAERLQEIVRRYTAWHARHHVAARVCQIELGGLVPEHYREILELRHATNSVFRDAVSRGVDDGTFTAVDVNRVVRAMFSLGIDLVRWYRPDRSDSPEQLGEFNAHLALTMVTSPPYRTTVPEKGR